MIPAIEPEKKRLIVILPDFLAGNLELAHKIHWVALREHCDVLYITLIDNFDRYLQKSRSMATMTAVTASNILAAHTKLVESPDWLKTLREVIRPDDIIICNQEQMVRRGWFGIYPLGEFLPTILRNKIIIISGFYNPVQEQLKRITFQLWYLAGFLVILVLFTALEIYLDHGLTGTLRIILLCLVVCGEFGTFYVWNNLISK